MGKIAKLKPAKDDDPIFKVIDEDDYGNVVIEHPNIERKRLYLVKKDQLVIKDEN